ncbi:MAG: hypothetical protein O3A82_02240 [Verrucomicrobia bacterium]|nr:hypothetical protein [Verrucomicrobiota bacterium]MDA0725283.1 hypothetical protein [Verrucomicrobiota bacterium]MDA1045729.1 hypothetical protein [Verrucomicrobiota bacterium]
MTTIQLEDGTKVGLWFDPADRRPDIPLLGRYSVSTPPYALQIYFPDFDPAWESAEIDEVIVAYNDGTTDKRTDGGVVWRIRSKEMTLYRGPLKDLVTRHESGNITVTGSISAKTGKKTGFSFSHKFEAEPKDSGIAPYWSGG